MKNTMKKRHNSLKNYRCLASTKASRLLLLIGFFLAGCGGQQAPDPTVSDLPIAYVKRSLPLDEDGNLMQEDAREPFEFYAGAQLIIRERASASASEQIISANVFPDDTPDPDDEVESRLLSLIDIKDLAVSYDGQKLLFSMRAPEIDGADPEDQPTWNIWEYQREAQTLRRIIESDIVAEEGQDIAPNYLPDGRIIFSSTRQRQARAILLDEGKPQYAALDENGDVPAPVLHVMNGDGSNIRQISFNQSHDLSPSVLDNGKVIYTRWDNSGGNDGMHLYSVNPDGTELSLLYGNRSHNSGTEGANVQFLNPKPMPDGRIMVLQKAFQSVYDGGDILLIDAANFVNADQPLDPSSSGSGQQSVTDGTIATDNSISVAGRFKAAYPLSDGTNRLLVAWSQCRLDLTIDEETTRTVPCTTDNLEAENVTEAQPVYGVYTYDIDKKTQLPVVRPEADIVYDDVVVMAARTLPNVLPDGSSDSFDQELASQGMGAIHIRSVYDFDGTDVIDAGFLSLADPAQTLAAQRPARFLRLVKAVPLPDEDLVDIPRTAFGRSTNQLMREIIGYQAIAPDGSVKVQVPANVPFMVSVLDQYGRRITARHNAWLQLRPGEVLNCNGCHDTDSDVPHGRIDAQAPPINTGAGSDGVPFLNSSPLLLPLEGETMAETHARINGIAAPNLNVEFQDDWTDEAVRALDPDLQYLYENLTTAAPTTQSCLTQWNGTCRIVINYPETIQPLFTLDRRVFDADGVTLLRDDTCTSCHAPIGSDNLAKVPDAQLDLSASISLDEPDHLTAFRELYFNDNEQELVNGVLIDRLVVVVDENGNIVFQTDGEGNLILDANGNPIPLTTTVEVTPPLRVGGSFASDRFVSLFLNGGTHAGRLSPDELRLLIEWMDIGGQYYNNPFAIPE